MLALPGGDPGIIGLDIMALIGCALRCAVSSWSFWPCCLALQALQVFAGPGVRYHRVRYIARLPDDLDI